MAAIYNPPKKCPECGSRGIQYNSKNAELYCNKCGCVITEQLPDYDQPKPCANISLSETKKTRSVIFPHSASTKKERNLKPVIDDLERISSLLNVQPYIKNDAMSIYMKIYEKGFTNGRCRTTLISSCLFIAIRNARRPILLNDFKSLYAKKPEKILDYAKQICKLINIKIAPPRAEDFISKFGNKLGLEVRTISAAEKIIDELNEKKLFDAWSFREISAGALFLTGKVRSDLIKAEKISGITKIEPEKITNIAKEMMFKIEFKVLKKISDRFFS